LCLLGLAARFWCVLCFCSAGGCQALQAGVLGTQAAVFDATCWCYHASCMQLRPSCEVAMLEQLLVGPTSRCCCLPVGRGFHDDQSCPALSQQSFELTSWPMTQCDVAQTVCLQIAGQSSQTAVMPNTRSPIYNSHHEFFNLQLPDVLTVQVSCHSYQPGRCCACCLMAVVLVGRSLARFSAPVRCRARPPRCGTCWP
jgi:hypothetical protein